MSEPASGPEPKLDWKPGDPLERWPHGFVQWSQAGPGVCGVILDNDTMQRCCGAPEWRIHNVPAESPARFCFVTADGRHPAGVVVARWEVPGIGDLCNYHAAEGWPDLFITRTVTSGAAADADLKRPRR